MASPAVWKKPKFINPFESETMQISPWIKSMFGGGQQTAVGFAKDGFAAPGAPGGGGGGNPYAGILNEFLAASKARFGAESAADAASRDAALRRYIISYGQAPDFSKMGLSGSAKAFLDKALDAKTRGLAELNTKEGTSVFARTKHANDLANRRIASSLAGRGILRSGQTGADLSEQAQEYKNTSFDQLNELLSGVEGTIGNFLAAERARQEALAQAELQAQLAAAQEWGGDMYGYQQPGPSSQGPSAPPSASPYAFQGSQAASKKKKKKVNSQSSTSGGGIRRYGY